ncbi:YpiF family protein [Neobacillus drentensis]|uniref:YpiF family protein n=1 Tax=Neobacillus drentensis TaxID=220684 RepID=UPI001F3EF5E8|nr:YpiF family protein [Neobacillus drentensis]ULT55469.1 YpiF family protein [Neobacillus drentensis]
MKWIPQEVETYLNAKEFVDTAVIPVYSLSFGEEMKQSAAAFEFISLLTGYLERQFTGRILMFPPFTYLKSNNMEEVISELLKWEETVLKNEFKHIFYITSELDWRMYENRIGGSLIWLPALPLGNMSETQKIELVDSQVKQLLSIFTQKWSNNE